MIGKFAADALGLSDIGRIINPKDFGKTESDDYIFSEDGEKIYFLIKSKTDEYCFTNMALIHLDGTSAVSKKRNLKRYDYYRNIFSNVTIETAGTVDLDVELKFNIKDKNFSVDVAKDELKDLIVIYKILTKVAKIQYENNYKLNLVEKSFDVAADVLKGVKTNSNLDISKEFVEVYDSYYENVLGAKQEFTKKDFSDVFDLYIKAQ